MSKSNREQQSQTRAHDTYVERRKALRAGLKKGLWTVGLTWLVTLAILAKARDSISSEWLWIISIGAAGTVLVGIGYIRWHAAQRADEGHHKLQKVPSVPLALLRDHDDAWIEGRVRCPQPLRPPGSRRHCSWFHLVVEQLRGSGKYEHWVTIRNEMHGTSIWITDGTREIEVDMREASIAYPEVDKRSGGRSRMSLKYVGAAETISACGVARYRDEMMGSERADQRDAALEAWRQKHEAAIKSEAEALVAENKDARLGAMGRSIRANKPGRSVKSPPPKDAWHLRSLDDVHGVPLGNRLVLTSHAKTPLVITPKPRHHWHDHAEASELATRTQADLVLGCGIPAIVWSAGVMCNAWGLAFWPGGMIGIVVMLALLFPPRIVRLFNRFVTYRQRIAAAHADLDADLALRSMLLPQLQAVVLAYAKHEQRVQKHVAALRQNDDTTDTVIALRESAPKLAMQENFASLADDMIAMEEKLAFGRAQLHDAIAEYNTLVQRFPANLLAKVTGFRTES